MADKPRDKHGRYVSLHPGICELGHLLVEPNLVEANLRQGGKVCKACSRARKRIQSSFRPGRTPLDVRLFTVIAHRNYKKIATELPRVVA